MWRALTALHFYSSGYLHGMRQPFSAREIVRFNRRSWTSDEQFSLVIQGIHVFQA